MKRLFLLLLVLVGLFACKIQRKAVEVNKSNVEVNAQDSVEYDVETFDQKFETWYMLHNTSAKYRSQSYYEDWNHQYVSAWNAKCASPSRNWQFEPVIGYEPGEDYGFEMNHKLFYYFMYVEHVLKIEIIPNGPRNY
ncbi:DUF6146 family protein [Maribellus sp. YY47]|uniref:DUF6146 family protein n=1 Tax=Maribellus sp. YY47 TaxID=2929486 RepID=UPI00200100F8|nr:DUF6146 family protein [Maribellus sp. YY47]MCK3685851.1 DUF6146 family protein [Maribellus sp. YY47]